MKVLFVGHDLSSLLFYDAIQKYMSPKNTKKFIHLYFRPSAYLYAKFILKRDVVHPPFFKAKNIEHVYTKNNKSRINLDFYGKNIAIQDKQLLLSKFYFYRKELIQKINYESIDIALVPGEFRIFEQAVIDSIKKTKKRIKLLYFEAGPPGYVYIDEKGVNANASFKKSKVNDLVSRNRINKKNFHADFTETKTAYPIIFLKFILNIIDVIWLYIPIPNRNTSDLIEYKNAFLNRINSFTEKIKKIFQPRILFLENHKYSYTFAFLGQVENDVNHTHFGVNQTIFLKYIDQIMANSDALILWRNHPLYNNNAIFLKVFNKYRGRIALDRSKDLKETFSRVKGVITVNSNGGLEALLYGLPVLLLGNSYYENLKGVERNVKDFLSCIVGSRYNASKEKIRQDAENFIRNSFFKINYRGLDFRNAYLISNLLCYAKKK
jgi:capsular polysaccharide export protein